MHMGMAGRPRKAGTRYASGDLKPEPHKVRDEGTPELQAQRLAAFGDARAARELICPIERLGSALTQEQRWAATAARASYARFAAAIGMPRIRAQLEQYVEGRTGEAPMTPEQAMEAVDRYKALVGAVQRQSFRALKEVERLMHGSPPRNLDSLKLGLEAVCDHLDLRQKKAA